LGEKDGTIRLNKLGGQQMMGFVLNGFSFSNHQASPKDPSRNLELDLESI
jgi:hypothetical protein